MKQTIYLVRHGETDNNLRNIYQGEGRDDPLNQNGIKQSEFLGRWIKKYYELPEIILSSPALRALQTANILKNELFGKTAKHPEIIVIPNLHEINHGEWEGKSDQEVKQLYPYLYNLWRTNPMRVKFPGEKGESMESVKLRILEAWHKEVFLREFNYILLVAHGGVNFQILNSVLESDKLRNVYQDNTGLNIIEKRKKGLRVRLLNSTAHLLTENT